MANSSNKDKAAAANLVKRGIYHGKRLTRPFANSGGMTMTWGPGSAKAQRDAKKK